MCVLGLIGDNVDGGERVLFFFFPVKGGLVHFLSTNYGIIMRVWLHISHSIFLLWSTDINKPFLKKSKRNKKLGYINT